MADDEALSANNAVISDVVETQFGLHLIKLEGVRSEDAEPLGVKRYEFEDEIKKEQAASLFYDQSERLAALAYENPDNLDLVTEELGLKVVTSEDFTRDKGEGLFANEDVRSIAFSTLVLQDNSNSDIIEISPTHVVVLRLNEHKPSAAIPLDVVRNSIVARIENDKGYEQTKAAALEVKKKIESGAAIDSFDSQEGIKVKMLDGIGRRDNDKAGSPIILRTAFDISPGQDGKHSARIVNLFDGNITMVVLKQTNAAVDIANEQIESIRQGLTQENANIEILNALTYMRNNASIDTNKRLLQE
jgi:peptidyl-prolyl cis-trans isomerase D